MSYRFRRRAFITAMSGGVGLKIMLRNLEGSAAGMKSPARLLVTHWPVGIVAGSSDALWKPTSGSVGGSLALKPFADQGLGPDMTVIRGLRTPSGAGGGEEGGMVALVTATGAPGTRAGMVEGDDAYAGGPSLDQILLRDVAALRRPGQGYANSIADSRTDFGEQSAKRLSYSTEFRDVPAGALSGNGREAVPLEPVLSPLAQYTNLFGGMLPGTPGTGGSSGGAGGGAAPRVADAMLKALVGRRSALDFARDELMQVRQLAPSGVRNKLTIHTDAVLAAEASVSNAINTSYPNASGGGSTGAGGAGGNGAAACGGGCTNLPAPPSSVMGAADPMRGAGNSFGNPRGTDDAAIHAQAGGAHLAVLKAAFVCDLIRVATYQWAPATTHVGFALAPGDAAAYQHHPRSHAINTADTIAASTLGALNTTAQFLFNVHTWYFSRHAETFAAWKTSVDGCGNSLLDFTCVPFLTEVTACSHERSNMAAMIIGGRKLGFVHDRYVTGAITINQLWGTIAQAFGHSSTDAPFAAPLPGFWAPPT
jgi:hypothetical protein